MGMHGATGISAFAYCNLRKHLGLPVCNVELVDGVQVLARVDTDILERFHCDCIFLRPKPSNSRIWYPRDGYAFLVPDYFNPVQNDKDEWIVKRDALTMRMPKGGYFFDGDWLSMENMWEDHFFQQTVREAERLYKETDFFIAFSGFYPYFGSSVDYFCAMLTEPETLIESNTMVLESELKRAALVVESMGEYIGAVCLAGDLGCQSGPMVRPEVFEEVSAPFLKKFCDFIHHNSDAKVFLHSCGAIEPLLPVLIYCGIDIINPVQVSAAGMNPVNLKHKYGSDIVFWGGGVDTQHVIGVKSPEEVAENTRYLTDIFKQGGGYVFCPVHNIMGNVPPENIVAAYDAAYENATYGHIPVSFDILSGSKA